jgi:chromosome segregation ATPase
MVEAQRRFIAHGSEMKSKIAMLDVALDRESDSRHTAEVELKSLKSRLESKVKELEHASSVTSQMERAYHEEKESWKQERDALLHDVSKSKDSSQALTLQLNTVETKLQSLDKELQSAHLQLAERGGQLAAHGKESEARQQQMYLLEDRLRQEKELNSQLSTKMEAMTERMTTVQSEAQFLHQQLDIANSKLGEREKMAQETQDRFSSIINSLRSDIEKSKEDGEVRNRELVQQVMQLKEELTQSEAFSQTQEREMKRLQQELLDSQKRQTNCEGSLEEVSKARYKLESDKLDYEKRLSQLQSQMATLESECVEAKHRVTTLTNQLGDSERAGKESLVRLETASAELAVLAKSKTDIERYVEQMIDKQHQLEAALETEKEKTIALKKELEKGNKIRACLESRVNDLKGDTNDLDDQLKETKAAHSLAVQEAEEARGLWETEVKSRSKLGMKLLEIERNQSNIRSTIDNVLKKSCLFMYFTQCSYVMFITVMC